MSPLVQKLRAGRRFAVELAPGKRVFMLRPLEQDMLKLVSKGAVEPADAVAHADGWEGFTEADLLGPQLGASDPVPFERDVFGEYIADRAEWMAVLLAELSARIAAHFEARAEAAKNLQPS